MNNLSLEDYQCLMANQLLSEELDQEQAGKLLQHLVPVNGNATQLQEAQDRFNIYRNNVILSLSTAIAETYPVIHRLTGDKFFNQMAIEFVRKNPPEQPSLLFYGEAFIDYIEEHPGCNDYPFLKDVARLEWYYIRAFHSADDPLLDNATLAEIAPEQLGEVAFVLHSSVHLMRSPWPVDVIWEENLKEHVSEINLEEQTEAQLLIYRKGFQVLVVNLAPECFLFLDQLASGLTISKAWEETLKTFNTDEQNDNLTDEALPGILGYLLGLSVFSDAGILESD